MMTFQEKQQRLFEKTAVIKYIAKSQGIRKGFSMKNGKRIAALVVLSMLAGMVYLIPYLRFTFYDQMAAALGLTDVQMGTIGSIYGVLSVVGYLPAGFLAEKYSARNLLFISSVGMLAATVWYAFFPGFIALCVIHGLFGIFSIVTFWSAYLKAVRNLGSESEQARLYGSSEAIRGVGQAVVSFICLAIMGSALQAALSFRLVIILNGVVFAILAVAVLIVLPKEKKAEGQAVKGQSESLLKTAAQMLKSKSVWICIFIIFCGFMVWTTSNSYMGTFCTRVLNISEELSSTLSIIRSYVIVLLAGLIGGVLMDKFKTKGVGLMVFFFAEFLAVLGVLFTENIVFVCIAVTIILGFFVNVIKATYWSAMGEAGIPREKTGMATGFISVLGFVPEIFASPVISRFISHGESIGNISWGFNAMLIWLAAWAALGILSAFILKKNTVKTEEQEANC